MNGLKRIDKQKARMAELNKALEKEHLEIKTAVDDEVITEPIKIPKEPKRSLLDKWGDKFRDFLDNVE